MKKLFYLAICIPVLALGQSTDQNYVKSTTYKQPTTTSNPNPDVNVANVQVSYFDGLGRPIQQIAHKQSNTGKDIVTFIEYDQYGRQTREYLPYVSTGASLNYIPSAQTDVLNFYASPNPTQTGNLHFEATGNPFSEKQLESSPLNRVFKQAAPGDVWAMGNGKEIKFEYQTNIENEVKFFKVVSSWNASKALYEPGIVQTSNYLPNQLYKTVTKDENWTSGNNNTTEEFKDKEGKVVLKRTYNGGEKHDTYYIYDQFGNLTYVIPPLAEGNASQTNLDNLGYQYKYDSRNRLVEKKLPGKAWEFIVYDKIDRPIATGPAYNPYGDGTLGWMITEYDAFGRVTQTGWKQMTVTETERKNNQHTVNSGGNPFALTQEQILTKNFYDNYSFAGAPSMPQTVEGQSATTATKGLQTGSWVRVLDTPGSTTAETSFTLYDFKFRPIRVTTTNFLGGYTEVDSKLDWSGKVEKTVTKHKYNSGSTVLTTTETFTYSPQDKLLVHKHKINTGSEVLIAKNNYDELGQLIKKEVGGTETSSFQKIDYKYNIRGWLKEINNVDDIVTDNDLFAFKIKYNDGATPLFNGNISETYWKSGSDNVLRKYEYTYDKLNRLLEANYNKPDNPSIVDSYLERLQYDKNGNITSLVRNGDLDANDFAIEIDNLVYTYDTNNKNQLMKVLDQSNHPQGFKDDSNGIDDSEDDYKYDNFGNLTSDANKGINNITYNHLNLPVNIVFANENSISYIYNALGQKVHKIVREITTTPVATTYMNGGFQYTNGVLNFFPHAEGYVNRTVGKRGSIAYNYVYQYKDHLGNNRLSFAKDPLAVIFPGQPEPLTILEENHYYPFGLKHTNYNTDQYEFVEVENGNSYYINIEQLPAGAQGSYKYKFLGQERQDELGLNWDTFRHRNYDFAIGRFMGIDPITEEYMSISPYQFAHNNPVWKIELEGLEGVETSGTDVINREPRVLAVFYHGGPFGDGNIRSTTADTGGTGDRYNATAAYARSQGMDFKGAIISPSATQGPGVETGKTFLENNYQDGDTVIVYGYSYGGDNAVNLAEAVPNIPINTMIIVDSSDGPLRGSTVDTSIPNNVNTAYNFFQDSYSGTSNASSSSSSSSAGASTSGPVGSASGASSGGSSGSSGSSSSQSSNSPGSRGYRHTSEGTAKVTNINVSGPNVTHGNIQTKAGGNIQTAINKRINEASQ